MRLIALVLKENHLSNLSDFGLAAPIQKALAAEGYETPTPIQAQAIPHVMAGRDLCGIAQTGTGKTCTQQPGNSHPVLVDLLSPDFNSPEQIENMLRVVAASIAKRAQVSLNNIFINHRRAHSGMVFDAGEVVRW